MELDYFRRGDRSAAALQSAVFAVAGLVTGWQAWRVVSWGVWGRPVQPDEALALLAALGFLSCAGVALIRPQLAAGVAHGCAAAAVPFTLVAPAKLQQLASGSNRYPPPGWTTMLGDAWHASPALVIPPMCLFAALICALVVLDPARQPAPGGGPPAPSERRHDALPVVMRHEARTRWALLAAVITPLALLTVCCLIAFATD